MMQTLKDISITAIENTINKSAEDNENFNRFPNAYGIILKDQYGINEDLNNAYYTYKNLVKKKDELILIPINDDKYYAKLAWNFNKKSIFSNLTKTQLDNCCFHWMVDDCMLKFYIFYCIIDENIQHVTNSIFQGVVSIQFKKLIRRINRRKKTYFTNMFHLSTDSFFGCKYFFTTGNDTRLFQHKKAEYIGNINSVINKEPTNLHKIKKTELPPITVLTCRERMDNRKECFFSNFHYFYRITR